MIITLRIRYHIEQIALGNFEEFVQVDFTHDVADINKQRVKDKLLAMMHRQGPEIAINRLNIVLQFKGDFSNLN